MSFRVPPSIRCRAPLEGATLNRILVTFAVSLVTVAAAQAADAIKPAPAFSKQQLVAPPTDAWIKNGGNLYNQRYSPLTEINRDTVKDLRGEWRIHLNS